MIRPQRTDRSMRRRAAFTLVEMIITIGVIVILTALTVSATVALSRRSEVNQTEQMLRLLDLAVQEWESETDRKVSWGDGARYDMQINTPHVFTLTEVLQRIRSTETVRSFLAQIRPEFLYEYNSEDEVIPPWLPVNPDPDDPDPNKANARTSFLQGDWNGGLAVLDPWNMPIRAVHPGRLHEPGDPYELDNDGTIYLSEAEGTYGVESIYGRCENRRIRLVSAGPDGKFGNLSANHQTEEHEQAHDNVHSYPVEDVH
ncbi:MAG: type II secretion system protein [Planctomycetota bacterium]|nr:type II secretion system protein [Planctomycetota bacterium]